jgi:hypothetical protein
MNAPSLVMMDTSITSTRVAAATAVMDGDGGRRGGTAPCARGDAAAASTVAAFAVAVLAAGDGERGRCFQPPKKITLRMLGRGRAIMAVIVAPWPRRAGYNDYLGGVWLGCERDGVEGVGFGAVVATCRVRVGVRNWRVRSEETSGCGPDEKRE